MSVGLRFIIWTRAKLQWYCCSASDGHVNIVTIIITQQSKLDEVDSLFHCLQVAKKLLMQLQHECVFPLTESRLFWMIHRPHCPVFIGTAFDQRNSPCVKCSQWSGLFSWVTESLFLDWEGIFFFFYMIGLAYSIFLIDWILNKCNSTGGSNALVLNYFQLQMNPHLLDYFPFKLWVAYYSSTFVPFFLNIIFPLVSCLWDTTTWQTAVDRLWFCSECRLTSNRDLCLKRPFSPLIFLKNTQLS